MRSVVICRSVEKLWEAWKDCRNNVEFMRSVTRFWNVWGIFEYSGNIVKRMGEFTGSVSGESLSR